MPPETAYVQPTTVGGILDAAAAAHPTAPAFAFVAADAPTRRWTYGELHDESRRAASMLRERFRPGERIAVWGPNSPEWLVLEYAAALAGLVLVTANPGFRSSELAHVLGKARVSGAFVAPEYRGTDMYATATALRPDLPQIREIHSFATWTGLLADHAPALELPDVDPDAPAQIQFTSGTTGVPKGTVLTHRSITNNAREAFLLFGLRPPGPVVHALPFCHAGGSMLVALGCPQWGLVNVALDGFDAARLLDAAEAERAAAIIGVPTMLSAIADECERRPRRLDSMEVVVSGGSAMPPALVPRLEAGLSARFINVYGGTETGGTVIATAPDDPPEVKTTSIGRPVRMVEVRIADPATGVTLAPGLDGELCVRTYSNMPEYFEDPASTRETIDADSWLHTGDVATIGEDGRIRLRGRVKDMIIRGGENIYPQEIERLLMTHDDVVQVAVVGVADDHWGEQVAAFVVAPGRDPLTLAAELEQLVREQLASFKRPRTWKFVDELPMTANGKIHKFRLQESLRASEDAHGAR